MFNTLISVYYNHIIICNLRKSYYKICILFPISHLTHKKYTSSISLCKRHRLPASLFFRSANKANPTTVLVSSLNRFIHTESEEDEENSKRERERHTRTHTANRENPKFETLTMAFEMPLDQIKQLQILLRKDANLSWYDPEDHLALPKLPSVAETVAKLDPSPPYLRCKNCSGRLLRGVQSSICVFCGANPYKDLPPEPIKFRNTLGYKWLLESLQLDGSVISISSILNNQILLIQSNECVSLNAGNWKL